MVVGGADPESLWISLFDCVWFVTLLAVNAVVYHELRVIKDTTAMGTSRTLLNLTLKRVATPLKRKPGMFGWSLDFAGGGLHSCY